MLQRNQCSRRGAVSVAGAIWRVAIALVLAVAIVPAAFAQPDTDPPVLVGSDFNPKSMNRCEQTQDALPAP